MTQAATRISSPTRTVRLIKIALRQDWEQQILCTAKTLLSNWTLSSLCIWALGQLVFLARMRKKWLKYARSSRKGGWVHSGRPVHFCNRKSFYACLWHVKTTDFARINYYIHLKSGKTQPGKMYLFSEKSIFSGNTETITYIQRHATCVSLGAVAIGW